MRLISRTWSVWWSKTVTTICHMASCHRFTLGLRCKWWALSTLRRPGSLGPYAQHRWSMKLFTGHALIQRRWFITNRLNVAMGASLLHYRPAFPCSLTRPRPREGAGGGSMDDVRSDDYGCEDCWKRRGLEDENHVCCVMVATLKTDFGCSRTK